MRSTQDGALIIGITPGSPAQRRGIVCGMKIVRINGDPVRDELDLFFLSSDATLRIDLLGLDGSPMAVNLRKAVSTPLGVEIQPLKARRCRNRCIFCFIDQNPPGLRPSLYLKDEDLRLSFTHGHYITGTGLAPEDLDRIASQRLSPLYISVHTTEPDLRARMLRIKPGIVAPIMDMLRTLAARGIQFHTQVVLCPQWNDGSHLVRTLDDLEALLPAILSVAIVPVGLTSHRKGLVSLAPMTPAWAREVIDQVESRQKRLRRQTGSRIILAADELYLAADRDIPAYTPEEKDAQIENGVGMVSSFWEGWNRRKARLPSRMPRKSKVAILTGFLGTRVLAPLAQRLSQIEGLEVSLVGLENALFGRSVTVSGLLTGNDFVRGLARLDSDYDLALLPANALNPDGLFLDGMSIDNLRERCSGLAIQALSGGAGDVWDAIRKTPAKR